jgi:hypothetical protein
MTYFRNPPPTGSIQRAQADFDTAHRKSHWRKVISLLTRQSNQLLPYDQVLRMIPVDGQHYIGMQQVPIDAIVGSVGRFQDFDRAFLPKFTSTRSRWESIDQAHLLDIDLPAVELYKLGKVYFVKDGNHRVSVARERGQAFIDAVVIEVDTPIPVTPETDILDLIGKREMTRFFRKTNLKTTRPEARIEMSMPELYYILLEHIQTHGWYLGEERQSCTSFEEAAISWYDNIYLPMVKVIREKKILSGFPGRTEADLYVWIMDHRWYQMSENQTSVSIEDAAKDYYDSYAENPMRRILHRISKFFKFGK